MTKYILHGGTAKEVNADNDSFFREMTFGAKDKTLILLNYFSREDNEVEQCSAEDKERFLQNSDNKDLAFEVASPENFGEQLERMHIMYMRGGDIEKLVKKLSQTLNLKELFQNKVISGSSAGAYALVKYYWGNDAGRIGEGLGMLNFKAYCHYKPEDEDKIKQLLAYKEDLPLFTLPDYKWIVLFR